MSSRTTGQDLMRGFDEGMRFRCGACGNLTRFDVVETARTRRYHHFDLGGTDEVEDEQYLDREVESVTCRWCGRNDAVTVEPAPSGGSAG